MFGIFTWTFMSYVPIFATACFHNVKPNFQKNTSSNGSDFMSAWHQVLWTDKTSCPCPAHYWVRHSALVPICLPLFMFIVSKPFSLYNKAVTSICCLSQQSWLGDLELRGHPAHRQPDPINSMPPLFSSFEEKHFVKLNSNRPPKLLLNNTWGGALHMSN